MKWVTAYAEVVLPKYSLVSEAESQRRPRETFVPTVSYLKDINTVLHAAWNHLVLGYRHHTQHHLSKP